METKEADRSNTSVADNIDEQLTIEEHLVTYLQNILKHQIIPINFMDLRNFVKEAPQNLQLFLEEKYPGTEFLAFLQKFSSVFKVNADKSVQIQGSSYCVSNDQVRNDFDDIDSYDKDEYISDLSNSD